MPLIDSLANVGLPRYLSAEEMLRVMDDHQVDAAVIAATPACADLAELSRAATTYPDRFRAIGAPVGAKASERRDSVAEQLESGFLGIHLPDTAILEEPELLTMAGSAGAVVFVTASHGLALAAGALLRFLSDFPKSLVLAPAFGTVGDPAAYAPDSPAVALLSHERFLVLFAGHGGYEPNQTKAEARRIIERVGWERALWGSDFPQCLWRGESYIATTVWIDKAGLFPDDLARSGFFCQNARRLLFFRPAAPRLIRTRERSESDPALPAGLVSLFPSDPIEIPEGAQHDLLSAYLDRSGPGTYRDFIAERLVDAARRLEAGDVK